MAASSSRSRYPDPWLRELANTDEHADVRRTAVQAIAAGWAEDPLPQPPRRPRADAAA
jgi:hypothetical protein